MDQKPDPSFAGQRKVRFNGEITLGHILTALTMVGVMMGMWRNFEIRMTKLEMHMEYSQKSLNALIVTVESWNKPARPGGKQ